MTSSHRFTAASPVYTYQRIVEQIEEAILSGEFPVGSQLPSERELMVQFGVSRPTVREALRVLQSMGLLEPRPGTRGGPVVLAPSADTLGRSFRTMLGTATLGLAELVQFRIVLDGSASELAAIRHDAEQLGRMRDAIERMREAAERDAPDFAEADLSFHERIWEASGNRILSLSGQAVAGALRELLQRDAERSGGDPAVKRDSARIDGGLFAAIERRDAAEAGRIARGAIADRFAPMLDDAERATLERFLGRDATP
ncbi:FadR/GntR family transcriptional regulator [Leucobacter massiliensis]|uniref:GntR family transcriptional regulator n=1 Tax=Leucobacter massiliensis TaxID=1686285 RepID=A0A2S9QPU2_9MICO|nr:FadR/GntR family transcriptional regulator [Leucobacter massiliensis]PRI11604.1 GntR family transcriptional regulator [Leucobacter massiliensis]